MRPVRTANGRSRVDARPDRALHERARTPRVEVRKGDSRCEGWLAGSTLWCRAVSGTRAAPSPRIGWGVLLGVAVCAVYWDVLAGLARQWASDENYSHGFLIAPLAAYFAWERRAAIVALPLQPTSWGLAGVLVACGLFALGTIAAEVFIVRVSFVALVAASIAFLFGSGHLRELRFPVLFLLFMIPLPALMFNEIALPLQLVASQVGEVTLRTAGIPVLREGNVLELEAMRLEVAEACSGIRSLTSLVAFALVLGRFNDAPPGRLWVLVLSTIPIAVIANAGRVAATGVAAHAWGRAVVEGAFHTAAGALVFVAAVATILAIQRLSCTPRCAVS